MKLNLIDEFKGIYFEENVENIFSFFAPGRVNLIGEHTDYNGGHVFPCAISFGTNLLVRVREDSKLNFFSLNFKDKGVITADLNNIEYKVEQNRANYCLGVINEFKKAGYNINKGLDILIYGDVPNGSGLSSSASLEVVTGGMLREIFKLENVSDIDLALLGQKAENNFCNVKCGIMDQFASSNGRKNCAIFLDCNTLKYEYAPLNMEGYSIVIVNTNKKHSLNDSEYNTRRKQCEEGFKLLKERITRINSLGDLSLDEFEKNKDCIKDELVLKRCRHAVYENQRTIKAVEALKNNDLLTFGKLMNESGDSLRYDFEVTCKELDVLVDLARSQEGVIGSRMTGGGFGGCTVNLVKTENLEDFIYNVGLMYEQQIGYPASFYTPDISDGFKNISIDATLKRLVKYGLINSMFEEEDEVYVTNKLLLDFQKKVYTDPIIPYYSHNLEEILNDALTYATDVKLIEDRITTKDLFDTKIMDELLDRPSSINKQFNLLLKKSSKKATEYFYKLNCLSNYVRTFRISKDVRYKYKTKYGLMDITINLSKPEKDPKAIAAALNSKSSFKYPMCQLCHSNLGYPGREDHPARENIRMIPITLSNQEYYLQYSPYAYFNEHCIVFNKIHKPMKVDSVCFNNLFEFVDLLPHYMVGSNADLPIVGGSILTHDHYQGGNYTFSMFKAKNNEDSFVLANYPDVKINTLFWPLSVVRLTSTNKKQILELANKILENWINYSNPSLNILAYTDATRHNTITPILHKNKKNYIFDLVLRNNRTDTKYEQGIFHVHPEKWNIKKENIGLIEVMGLAVLPSRLKNEMELIIDCIKNKKDFTVFPELKKQERFINEIISNKKIKLNNLEAIKQAVYNHVGYYFLSGLEDCGVFKLDEIGLQAFHNFLKDIK